jgi:glutamyl-Q tRNA(Asp) synthetase
MAVEQNGDFLLRIEDIDQSRARPEWEAQIYDDLKWLGIRWPTPVMRQSERQAAYGAALDDLWARGFLYPCTCTRQDIQQAMSAPQEGVTQHGPDGLIYPGTCASQEWLARALPEQNPRPKDVNLRLDMSRVVDNAGVFSNQVGGRDIAHFTETGSSPDGAQGDITFDPDCMIQKVGDIVLARRDMGTSYHLSVVLDDAVQEITHVVRGQDLFEATKIHVVLQRLMGVPTPIYHHHKLIRDENGKRLAKRDDARAISLYRQEGLSPDEIRSLICV